MEPWSRAPLWSGDRRAAMTTPSRAPSTDLVPEGRGSAQVPDKLQLHLASEWLQTDGVGGYASSTRSGCATRRYHGWLVARPIELAKRHLFVSRVDELLSVAGRPAVGLGLAEYADGFAPPSHELDPEVAFEDGWSTTYRVDGAVITRTVRLARGAPTVLCRYHVESPDAAVRLELRPLLPCREADALTFANDVADLSVASRPDGWTCQPYEVLPAVHASWNGRAARAGSGQLAALWHHDPVWYRGVHLRVEADRGYDAIEDQPSPGRLVVEVPPGGGEFVLAFSIAGPVADPLRAWRDLPAGEPSAETVRDRIAATAHDFLYRVPETGRLAVCAGYPWFGEWGRDSFIALPGLTLALGDRASCREAIASALPFLRRGLLPNIFGLEVADSHYGSIDASLWFARAVDLWLESGRIAGEVEPADADDARFLANAVYPALVEIADAYLNGTGLGVHTDEGLLIVAGGPDLNPTWMDARAPDGPVTPRAGCAVEINGLWIALLDMLAELAPVLEDAGVWTRYAAMRDQAAASFIERFWLVDDGYLADCWTPEATDRQIRPNMLFVAALARVPLDTKFRRGVVDCATEHLLTPRGMRTLAPREANYVPRYAGGWESRDRAYHQGTVWPWLIGAYVEARLRAYGAGEVDALRALLDGFGPTLDEAGREHVSEVFDGDPPHRPGGTIAQAWSSAEILRGYELVEAWRDGDPR